MHKTKFLFVLFAIFLCSSFSSAQVSIIQKSDSTGYYKLSDVVITATKTPTNTLELANSISIIDSAQISNSNSNNVFDVLKNETGISFTRQGGNGTLSNLYIRGANSSHTLVLIDGVEVNLTNDPSGVYDFSALPIDNIERIEVLRGPQSTLYGSDALAGVINIISKKGSGPPQYSLLTEAGSYNSYKALLGLNGSIQKLNYSASFSRTQSDGYSVASEKYGNTESDGYYFNNFSALVGYSISETAEINFYTRYLKSESDNDQFGGEFGDDPTYLTNQGEFSIRGEAKLKLFDEVWNQKLGLTFFRNVRNNSYDTSAASINYPFYVNDYSWAHYDGRKYKIDWQNDFQITESNLLTAGLEFEIEESASEYYAFNYVPDPFSPDIESVIPMNDAKTFGVYIQDQLKFEDSFFITLGARLDDHSKFGSQFTYKIAPAYMHWETGTKIKATIGTGFKAPSLYYLYDPAYGNENLNPEESFGWDFGLEQFLFSQNITLGVTYFYNKFTDMFGFDYVTFKTINIKEAITKGFEAYIEVKPSDELNIKVNYTYTDARDISPESSDFNKKLLRRPGNKTGLFASYTFIPKANLTAEVIWVGIREDINFSTYERTELKEYVLLNLAAHYDVFDFLRLQVRAENLLDTDYEEVFGYGTAGLSFYGGIKLSL